jgi:hypothetical protein
MCKFCAALLHWQCGRRPDLRNAKQTVWNSTNSYFTHIQRKICSSTLYYWQNILFMPNRNRCTVWYWGKCCTLGHFKLQSLAIVLPSISKYKKVFPTTLRFVHHKLCVLASCLVEGCLLFRMFWKFLLCYFSGRVLKFCVAVLLLLLWFKAHVRTYFLCCFILCRQFVCLSNRTIKFVLLFLSILNLHVTLCLGSWTKVQYSTVRSG